MDNCFINFGCGAPNSIARYANTVYWIGSDKRNQLQLVYSLRIAHFSLFELALEALSLVFSRILRFLTTTPTSIHTMDITTSSSSSLMALQSMIRSKIAELLGSMTLRMALGLAEHSGMRLMDSLQCGEVISAPTISERFF